jgi:predicted ATPase
MARLDRLGPVKEVAQIGAAIGREFSHELLGAISDLGEGRLGAALNQLAEAELVFRRGLPPDATYTFKHALVRDAAYESLLRGKRRQLHARIAHVLKERFPDTVATRPELLARHFTEAGLTATAVGHWLRAGQHAAERSANTEAIGHLQKGLALLDGLPAGQERDPQELALLTALGPLLMASHGRATPEVERLYARARGLAATSGRPADLFPAVWGWWLFSHARGDHDTAATIVTELLLLAEGEPELELQAQHAAWATRMTAGDLLGARDATGAGLRLYRREVHGRHALVYGGHDPGVCGLSHAAHVLWMLGYPDQAAVRGEEALALARELGHTPSLAHALWFVGELRLYGRDAAGTAEIAAALDALTAEQDLSFYAAMGAILGGWALAAGGQVGEGLALLRPGFATWRDERESLAQNTARMAEVCGAAGEPEEGLRLIEEALEHIEGWNQRLHEAELLRLRGALSLLLPEPDRSAAESSLRRALVAARERGVRLWELRAAVDLARLWLGRGERAEARDLLDPIYGWFTEGFDTPDLRDARALLDDLR